uniref:Reverse transcriptase domain-containing protein n=1 Tax=Caenorhabditis japonica TaxID=281687 RepID=A0A8R1I4J6_CAEJA
MDSTALKLFFAPQQKIETQSDHTNTINFLNGRIPMFTYNPEDGEAFDRWYGRFEDVIVVVVLQQLRFNLIDKAIIRWLGYYHYNRKIRTQFGDEKSKWRTLKRGVPQEVVLSPVLFNVYIKDVPAIPEAKIIGYADDMTILVQDPTL